MANRKLSIGCVLLVGGALTNCGGIVGCSVGTPAEPSNDPHGTAGSGAVGVPPDGAVAGAPDGGASGSAGGAGLAGFGGAMEVPQHGGESSVAGAAGADGS